uniref:Uncharacterized protein n=1 Tax=Ditylenchus dipsaci TaxID=166011 RepID=A0A915DDA4_9BILA
MIFYSTLLLLLGVSGSLAAQNVENVATQVAAQSTKVLAAGRNGDMIRQCSCQEQTDCVDDMKKQAVVCFQQCWETVKLDSITRSPDELKTCFEAKEYIIDDFLSCLGEDVNTCVKDKNGPQIPYTDVNKVISAGEKKLTSQAQKFMISLNKDGHELLQTALNVGSCIKNCFVKENSNGYCFDKSKCQPKLMLMTRRPASRNVQKRWVGKKKHLNCAIVLQTLVLTKSNNIANCCIR